MPQISDRAFKKLVIALAVYLVSLFAANTLGLKLMPFLFGTHLSVAVFSFPVVFLMTDVIGELYGKKMAKLFVLAGFVSVLLWTVYVFLSLAMPWSDDANWVHNGYNTVFGMSARIAIASVVAFVVAEYQDVISFFFFRNRFGKAGFWLRSNLSNIWSQFLDTTIFMAIAFLPVPFIPFLANGYSIPVLVDIIITWWLFKVAMGILYTPLSYVGLRLLRDEKTA
ncbi:MAG: queuosine precursor transporter [bacterium]|nr:queuosine precursor transporter [bacterium]